MQMKRSRQYKTIVCPRQTRCRIQNAVQCHLYEMFHGQQLDKNQVALPQPADTPLHIHERQMEPTSDEQSAQEQIPIPLVCLHACNTQSDACNTQSDACDTQSDASDTQSDACNTQSDACNTQSDACNTLSDDIASKFRNMPYANAKSLASKLLDDLRQWAITNNVPLSHITQLLAILKPFHPHLPLEARTVLKTPRASCVRQMGDGRFSYLGIQQGIIAQMQWNVLPTDGHITLQY